MYSPTCGFPWVFYCLMRERGQFSRHILPTRVLGSPKKMHSRVDQFFFCSVSDIFLDLKSPYYVFQRDATSSRIVHKGHNKHFVQKKWCPKWRTIYCKETIPKNWVWFGPGNFYEFVMAWLDKLTKNLNKLTEFWNTYENIITLRRKNLAKLKL